VLDEQPDPLLMERHEREVFPLLHRRAWFAEADDFLLYDLLADGGGIDEHVFAYSNGSGPTRSLVIYHDRFATTAGVIRDSAAYAHKSASGARRLVRRSVAEGLGLPNDPSMWVAYRDARTGLEYLRSCREIWEHGMRLTLGAYQGHVFWEFRELHDGSSGQWRRLAERLAGGGVPSLEEALREQQLAPVHAAFRAIFADRHVAAVIDGTAAAEDLAALEARFEDFLAAVAQATGVPGDPVAVAPAVRVRTERAFATIGAGLDRVERAALLGWVALSRTGELASGADVAATSAAWYDELRLAPVLATGLRSSGLDEGEAWAAAETVRVLLALPRPSQVRGRTPAGRLLERWLALDPIRTAIGVNTWQGVEWLERERFEAVLRWAVRLDAIEGGGPPDEALVGRLASAAEAAGYRVDALLAQFTPRGGRQGGRSGRASSSAARSGARRTRGPKRPPAT